MRERVRDSSWGLFIRNYTRRFALFLTAFFTVFFAAFFTTFFAFFFAAIKFILFGE